MKEYIVLWKNNGRLGSVERTIDNLNALKAKFHLSLIQQDITGTEHYEVLGTK